MRVLWLINVPLPKLAKSAGIPITVYGGWLVKLADQIAASNNIELFILFKQTQNENYIYGSVDNIKYCGFYQNVFQADKIDSKQEKCFKKVLSDFNPDLIQIIGTEHIHSYIMMKLCKELNITNKVLVTIQGLVSKYALHYYADLPFIIRYGFSIRDLFRGNVRSGYKDFLKRGKYEEEVLRIANNVSGRTDWDEACVKSINKDIRYFCNKEILRDEFYNYQWDYSNCEKHSIFFSQASYPIKGLHKMIEALEEIVAEYPEAKLYISGNDFRKMPNHKKTLYHKYILKMVRKKKLESNIVFYGTLQEKEMCQAYLRANVFVCASSIENSPNSVGEAMLLGVPVVSSDVGGVKNMLTHNEEGFIYQFDAPYMLAYYIKKIFRESEKVKEISYNARRHALDTHNIEQNVSQLLDIYNIIAKQN